jgi:minor histocompatibility antigen H13
VRLPALGEGRATTRCYDQEGRSCTLIILANDGRSHADHAKPTYPKLVFHNPQDAIKFPLVGSALLLSLFLAYKFLPADLLNMVVSAYFVAIGTLGMVATVDPIVAPFLPAHFSQDEKKVRIPPMPFVLPEGVEFGFTLLEALLCIPAAAFCTWYWQTKHWLANNGLGIAFSLQGIEHLSLGTVQNGVILLSLLFVYDIFWVFCTPVMVTVAKKFDAPIKLLFPRVPPGTPGTSQFSMLGLGDIVIPGIFVAIVLRYDGKYAAGKSRLFYSAFAGYVLGLAATILVMTIFEAAQPALLYIVPAVLLCTFLHAFASRQASSLYHYDETHGKDKEHTSEEQQTTPSKAAPSVEEPEATERRMTRSAIKAAKKDT